MHPMARRKGVEHYVDVALRVNFDSKRRRELREAARALLIAEDIRELGGPMPSGWPKLNCVEASISVILSRQPDLSKLGIHVCETVTDDAMTVADNEAVKRLDLM